jgi:predicted Zn-dependent protease
MTTLDDLDGLIKQATTEGALGVEVLLRERVEHHASATTTRKRPRVDWRTSAELTVRVWVQGGRKGVMTGDPAEGADLVAQALASTFEAPEDPFGGPVGRLPGPAGALAIDDRRYARVDDEARVAVLDDLVDQARQDKRFTLTEGRYRDRRERRVFANSKGVRLDEHGTAFRLDARVEGAGLDLRQHTASTSFASVASLPLGTTLLRRGDELLQDGRQLEPGPVRVVLPPLAMSRLLAVLAERFGPNQIRGEGWLSTGGPGVSARLHLVDDAALPGGLRSRSFDDRGVPPVPLTVLREGQVAGRFLTPERARQLGTRPTGHCHGETVRAGNLVMREGTRSINALLTEHGGPSLQIDDLPDLSGLDLDTGALDVTVDGLVMAANETVGAMRGVRLTGNVATLLQGVVEVCNNTDRIGHIDAASIIADGLTLVG